MVSLIRPDNEASVKVAMKMGMKKEKTISKWDQMIDVYSVTRDGKSGSLES